MTVLWRSVRAWLFRWCSCSQSFFPLCALPQKGVAFAPRFLSCTRSVYLKIDCSRKKTQFACESNNHQWCVFCVFLISCVVANVDLSLVPLADVSSVRTKCGQSEMWHVSRIKAKQRQEHGVGDWPPRQRKNSRSARLFL